MSVRKAPWLTALVGALAVAAVAALGSWRRRPDEGCALDGSHIDAIYRVRVIDRDGGQHDFCCVACARVWLGRQSSPPRAVYVTDEDSGELIDAQKAMYVQTWVVTTPITQNRIHVFRDDPESRAKDRGGIKVDNPFSP